MSIAEDHQRVLNDAVAVVRAAMGAAPMLIPLYSIPGTIRCAPADEAWLREKFRPDQDIVVDATLPAGDMRVSVFAPTPLHQITMTIGFTNPEMK